MPHNCSRFYAPSRGGHRACAPLIAIIGSDGAGKTTLASYLCTAMEDEGAVYSYLGLGTGAIGLKIKGWPLIGPALERRLAAKAKQARTVGAKVPGIFTALTIYIFSRLRARRFTKMLSTRQCVGLVICDRYPQVEVPGFYDGPGLSAASPKGILTAWIAKRERALYLKMVQHRPALVIRLNVDAQTALLRKPDHIPYLIRQKVEATALLKFNGARIVDVDASQPLMKVQAQCLLLVQQTLGQTGR